MRCGGAYGLFLADGELVSAKALSPFGLVFFFRTGTFNTLRSLREWLFRERRSLVSKSFRSLAAHFRPFRLSFNLERRISIWLMSTFLLGVADFPWLAE